MKKRMLSMLLLVAMLVALFSGMTVSASAAEGDAGESASVEKWDFKAVFKANLYVAANPEAGLPGDVAVQFKTAGMGTLYLPGSVKDASQLSLCWDDPNLEVTKDGVTYESGTAPVAAENESVCYRMTKGNVTALITVKTVKGSEGVQAMFLNLDESLGTIDAMNGDETHETECFGTAVFGDTNKPISIKGRGNSTWGFDKKPYNITFYKKADFAKKDKTELIPGIKAKKWSLLANYLDNSLIRNKLAMDLAHSLGIGLASVFVDVWMNGEYLGNYLMTPKNDYAAPDGGYALENDNYLESEDPQFQIPGMYEIGAPIKDDGYYNRITVKDIGENDDDVPVTTPEEIEAYFLEAWNALEDYDSENYQNYFDLDSWAKMFLMYEVSKTYDCYAGSLLMHRDGLTESDKLVAGPAWDYDVAFGRTLHKFIVGVSEPMQLNAEGWYNDAIGLVAVDKPISLLQELGKHESFMKAVAEVYNANRALFEDVPANVDRQRETLRASALMNNVLWGTNSLCADYLIAPNTMRALGTGKYALNYEVTLTWENYVNNLKEFASKRVMWLTDHLYAQAPYGSIVTGLEGDDVVLTAVLTAGNDAPTYQWQSRAAGEDWANVEGANDAALTLKNATAYNGREYRCLVRNAGVDIYTTHGGWTKASAAAVLEPVTIDVAATQTLPVAPEYSKLYYKSYTYIGDSISWGYGLDPADGHADPNLVCARIDGSFPDLVGKVLEAVSGAEVHSAASSGGRMSDFRMILERGLGVENPYTYPDDWFGRRNAVRTDALRDMWPSICENVKNSDLVTVEAGINDLSSILVNALEASGLIDVEKLTSISGVRDVTDYLAAAMKRVAKSPTMLTNVTRAFNAGVKELRENSDAVIRDVTLLAPDADVLVVGMYNASKAIRVLPGTEFSPIMDLIGAALTSLNDYYATLAAKYDNVYYVDAPDATTIYQSGTTVVQALQNKEMTVLKGLHPDAAGHRYIADCVLDQMVEINACRHTHTKVVYEGRKLLIGVQYIGTTVCTDCGKVLDSGKFVTPTGTYNVPTYTVGYAAKSVAQAHAATIGKITDGFSKLFAK